ncbi:MAG TPA: glycosyltransferase [Bryobacteraceae bacterium]|nr:glycosyltransferase [Bryobacteraceae bacterium]
MPQDLVLIFAYHFPPENVIGAVRPYRFYKYLLRLGYRCHVITAADVAQRPDLDAERVSDPFVDQPRIGVGWQIERAIRKFLMPGVAGSQWSVHAYRAALRFIDKNPGYRVTLFSTFPPMGVHFAAYWLARQRQLPWIADYRDPVGDNPIHSNINRFTQDVYRKLERIFVRANDVAIANTDAAQTKLKRDYPNRAGRIELIWNGFDPEERLVALPPAFSDRKVLAHVGELYGGRDASPILRSLRRLIDQQRIHPGEILVHLAGPAVAGSVPDAAFMEMAAAEGWLRLDSDRVPQQTAHLIIQTANYLLLIQPQTALQVPGKLFEYLQIGRPILALVPPDSPVERILAKSGVPYLCVYPSASDREFDNLIFEFLQLSTHEVKPSQWFEDEFNAEHHAGKVAQLVQQVQAQVLNRALASAK